MWFRACSYSLSSCIHLLIHSFTIYRVPTFAGHHALTERGIRKTELEREKDRDLKQFWGRKDPLSVKNVLCSKDTFTRSVSHKETLTPAESGSGDTGRKGGREKSSEMRCASKMNPEGKVQADE